VWTEAESLGGGGTRGKKINPAVNLAWMVKIGGSGQWGGWIFHSSASSFWPLLLPARRRGLLLLASNSQSSI
jgi:hypothetical protein